MDLGRIELNDSVVDAVVKLVEGNPGAMQACMCLIDNAERIDPQSALDPYGPLLSLDTHGIYGSAIYVLWNDKCDRDPRKMIMLLRSVQLGFLPVEKLKEMAEDQLRQVNLTDDEWAEVD